MPSPPDRAPRRLVGVLCSDRDALVHAAQAVKLLDQLDIGIRVFVMPPSGVGNLLNWTNELRDSGGFALWALITSSAEIANRAAALEPELPLYCQLATATTPEQEAAFLQRITELSAAMLPAGRMREAALHFTKLAALLDPDIAKQLRAMQQSAEKAAQKKSDFITANLQTLLPAAITATASTSPSTSASAATNTPSTTVPPASEQLDAIHEPTTPEDEEILRQTAAGMMQPRIRTRTEEPAAEEDKPARKAFDYSVPLRQVLTGAKEIAAAYRNPKVTPEHLLAAIIDSPTSAAQQLLIAAGVNLETLAGHLIPHFPPPHEEAITGMFSMADTTWTVLENARTIARERERPCLTTLDFLEAIALRTNTGATASLWEAGLLATTLSTAIETFDASAEYNSLPRKPEPDTAPPLDPDQARELQKRLAKKPAAPPSPGTSPASATAPPPQAEPTPTTVFAPEPKATPDILRCSPDNPELEIVETVADALLEGRLVAFPIDVMYALVADATNPAAVRRLRDGIQADADKHLAALVHSTTQLKHLVQNVSPEVSRLLNEMWPGPLTVVFDRHPQRFEHLSSQRTLGLRIPSDYLSLAILSTVGRPLAATSIALEEGEGAKHIAQKLAGIVDIIIETEDEPNSAITSILSVASGTNKLLRQGAATKEQIESHVGQLTN